MHGLALYLLFTTSAGLKLQEKLPTPAPIVFLDIAGPNIETLRRFYSDLFGWTGSANGSLTIPIASPLPAVFRLDPAEKRIYIGVENIANKLEQIKALGGTIDAPRFEVPGVAVLALFKDPAGNAMALVEMENGKPKIP